MKMKPEHYRELLHHVGPVMRAKPYNNEHSPMRWRWDSLHFANDTIRRADELWLSDWWNEIYAYCNDENIDTALRLLAGVVGQEEGGRK